MEQWKSSCRLNGRDGRRGTTTCVRLEAPRGNQRKNCIRVASLAHFPMRIFGPFSSRQACPPRKAKGHIACGPTSRRFILDWRSLCHGTGFGSIGESPSYKRDLAKWSSVIIIQNPRLMTCKAWLPVREVRRPIITANNGRSDRKGIVVFALIMYCDGKPAFSAAKGAGSPAECLDSSIKFNSSISSAKKPWRQVW